MSQSYPLALIRGMIKSHKSELADRHVHHFVGSDSRKLSWKSRPTAATRAEPKHWSIDRFGAVMLFCDRLSQEQLFEAKASGRENLLETLLADFRKAFPELTFELQLDFRIINAQALKLEDRCIVSVYGGLALHPRLGANSLAFILLHEAGHHLAEGCRSRRDPSLACECAADHWAVTVGTDKLLQKSGRHLQMRIALEELNQVMTPPRQPSQAKYTGSGSTSGCWAQRWSSRHRALVKRARAPTIADSCISFI